MLTNDAFGLGSFASLVMGQVKAMARTAGLTMNDDNGNNDEWWRSYDDGIEIEPLIWLRPQEIVDRVAGRGKPTWFWRGLIRPGAVTLLIGDPKVGKTSLVFQYLKSMGAAHELLGLSTLMAQTWYVTEESDETIAEKIEAYRLSRMSRWMEFLIAEPGRDKHDIIELLHEALLKTAAVTRKLVVIDTLAYFLAVEDENDSVKVGEGLKPFLELKHIPNTAVLLLHHNRKSGGRHGSEARGSSVFLSHVDVIASIKWEDGTKRRLEVTSRFLNIPDDVEYFMDTDYSLVTLEVRNERIKVLAAQGWSQSRIAEIYDISQQMVSKVVNG